MILRYWLFTKQTGLNQKIFKAKEIYGYTLTLEPELTKQMLDKFQYEGGKYEIYTIEFEEKKTNARHKGFVLQKNGQDKWLGEAGFDLKNIYTDAELVTRAGIIDME